MDTAIELAVLLVAGLAAGYINAVAGSGSLLTLPALIFTGLDAGAANATNRVAVAVQNVAALVALRRNGYRIDRRAWLVSLPAAVTAGGGAYLSTLLSEQQLRLSIAAVMVIFLVLSMWPRKKAAGGPAPPLSPTVGMALGIAALGVYAGFLQAGVGVAFLLYLSLVHGTHLVTANALKLVAILVLTIVAIAVFIAAGEPPDPLRGGVLAVGTAVGGYLGGRDSLRRGERFVRVVLVVAVVGSCVKLVADALLNG